jgi:hypothetical protein
LGFGHSPLTLLPFAQKDKKKFKNFKTTPTAVGKKKRNTSANSVYLVTLPRLRFASARSLHPYLASFYDIIKEVGETSDIRRR